MFCCIVRNRVAKRVKLTRKFEIEKICSATNGQPVGIAEEVLQVAVIHSQQSRTCILHRKRTSMHNSIAVIRPDPQQRRF
jgi:hypothetical protein